jgi:hypothetical protein
MCSVMANRAATSNFRRFSDAISDPLVKTYRAGGFGLALLFIGAIFMLTAFFWTGPTVIQYIVLLTGALLTFFVLVYVYFKEFPRLRRARASVAANKEMIDAIQQSAIELTAIASDLQALAFKNASQIAEVLTVARPFLRKIPLLGPVGDSEAMAKAEGLSRLIVNSTQNARQVVTDLQQALIEANPKYLKVHLDDLRRYRGEVNKMLLG